MHQLPDIVTEWLQAKTAEQVSTALNADGHSHLACSERGLLQLALDVSTLSRVLAPPPSPSSRSSAAAEDVLASVYKSIAARLDPIDWASYEPFLKEHVREGIQQKAVHLGLLLPSPPALQVLSSLASAHLTTARATAANFQSIHPSWPRWRPALHGLHPQRFRNVTCRRSARLPTLRHVPDQLTCAP
jgi:hypothetical protein